VKRLASRFAAIRRESRCGLVAYVTCGDPDPATTVEIVRALEGAGADVIELGMPFSDPIADGPVIQAASQRALERGTRPADLFEIARQLRSGSEIPLVAFSYLNPIVRYGIERFADAAAGSGIDALLITDLPPEAGGAIRAALHERGVGLVSLLAPTSPDKRVKLVERKSDGFVYYVSTNGVTGARRELDPALLGRLQALRRIVKKPLAVGFGVSEHSHYQALAPHCDAVVVGSAIVRSIAEGDASGAPERAAAVVRRILRGES
jgi:tryptophan synthase alpha chain